MGEFVIDGIGPIERLIGGEERVGDWRIEEREAVVSGMLGVVRELPPGFGVIAQSNGIRIR